MCSPGARDCLPSIGVVVVTHRARDHLEHCLPPLLKSPLRPRVLVVNSSSGDGTVERAAEMGVELLVIPRASFDHGLTRERARRHLGTEIVVMMTPDAYPQDEDFLDRLTAPVRWGDAAVAYARQIPHADASLIERFGRSFNYPERSQLRALEDWPRHGSYLHFCSNAAAAWSGAALDAVGGFTETLVTEESVAVCKLLARGHRIAYVADAVVRHSHRYGLWQEFQRNFDIGYARRANAAWLLARERDEVRGAAYLSGLVEATLRERPAALPYALLHVAHKLAGYRLGLLGRHLPRTLARLCSSQDFFWQRGRGDVAAPRLLAGG